MTRASLDMEPTPRPLLGYMRVPPEFPARHIESIRRSMAAFASQEGFVLRRILVDQNPVHTIAFFELMVALLRGEAEHVVVPTIEHLALFPAVQLAMRELVETRTGARLLVMTSSAKEAG